MTQYGLNVLSCVCVRECSCVLVCHCTALHRHPTIELYYEAIRIKTHHTTPWSKWYIWTACCRRSLSTKAEKAHIHIHIQKARRIFKPNIPYIVLSSLEHVCFGSDLCSRRTKGTKQSTLLSVSTKIIRLQTQLGRASSWKHPSTMKRQAIFIFTITLSHMDIIDVIKLYIVHCECVCASVDAI